MTKQDILDQFKDINQMYNNCNMLEMLSSMIDELINEQVPHVMTPEEVERVEEQGIVWCEYKKTNRIIPLMRIVNIFEAWDDYVLLCEVTDCDDYLKEYRFWNLQPTNAQRNATPWEPMKEE